MTIKYEQHGNCISVITSIEIVEELKVIDDFFLKILIELFINQDIRIVTREPQSYSLGYEFSPHTEITIAKLDLLINDIVNCDRKMLEEISQSEEFERGLLMIIKGGTDIEEVVLDIFKSRNYYSNKLTDQVAFCEGDGSLLLLWNSALSIDQLNILSQP